MPTPTLLIVEDNHALAIALAAAAENCGLLTQMAPTLAIARQTLDQGNIDGLLLDIGLPDGHGLGLVEQWKWEHKPTIAVITAHGEIENAIAARKLGIARFFDKPVNFDALQEFFKSILSSPANAPATTDSNTRSAQNPPTSFISSSPVMRPVVHHISHTCCSDQPVVISGAPGTGKTHVAHTIQQSFQPSDSENASSSGTSPNVIQASALLTPSQLIKKLEDSKNNSLIIESIHSMPMEQQELLALTIDDLGDQAPRLIVTTDEDGLTNRFNQGGFNRDLYFRLQILEIKLPTLASRPEDLRAIATSFLKESATANSHHSTRMDDSVFDVFQQYPWPGNLRELRNIIHHAVVTAEESPVITSHHLPSYISAPPSQRKVHDSHFSSVLEAWVDHELSGDTKYKQLSTKLERALLEILLTRFDNKPSRLAAELSINRSTLRKKLNSSHT